MKCAIKTKAKGTLLHSLLLQRLNKRIVQIKRVHKHNQIL